MKSKHMHLQNIVEGLIEPLENSIEQNINMEKLNTNNGYIYLICIIKEKLSIYKYILNVAR